MSTVIGRYAPSPSGDLHLGNLRTAVIAWLCAPHDLRLRIDDIDAQRSSPETATRQLADLHELGLRFSGPVVHQQDNLAAYEKALASLDTYECYCSRKDIQEAVRAPHAAPGSYPGTCRELTETQRVVRREELRGRGRVPAVRLASGVKEWTVAEQFAVAGGRYTGAVDDMVLRRGGNIGQASPSDYAYNLAVVVDDALAGVTQVVRGDDLLSSAPRQAYLASLLVLPEVEYVHVPLVLGPTGQRLAKRDGAVTLRQLGDPDAALQWILSTILPGGSLPAAPTPGREGLLRAAAEVFDLAELPREPVVWH